MVRRRDDPSPWWSLRCYLPGEDLDRLGLTPDDLRGGARREPLDELIQIQVHRGRDLLTRAAPAAGMVGLHCQGLVHAIVLGAETHLGEVARLGARILVEGLSPEALAQAVMLPRKDPPAHAIVPAHVAVIMDGSRRWATERGLACARRVPVHPALAVKVITRGQPVATGSG